jgi:hypothetical protein
MSDFGEWEHELGPEITGTGKPMRDLSDAELDTREKELTDTFKGDDQPLPDDITQTTRTKITGIIGQIEGLVLTSELSEIEQGKSVDQLAEEARQDLTTPESNL